jgi:hypothetical protein
MNESTTKPTKPKFNDVCMGYQFDGQALQEIADISGVPRRAVDALFLGKAVERAEALILLAVLSQRTGHVWSLDNVDVPLLPTFADLSVSPGFDAGSLSLQANVPFSVIDQMLCDHPVSKGDALKVLSALSRCSGHQYTLDNVVVNLTRELGGQSEVTCLLKQIREEYEAAMHGVSGLAQGTSRHRFITTKMENMGKLQEKLQELVGDGAMVMVIQGLDQLDETNPDEQHRNTTEK